MSSVSIDTALPYHDRPSGPRFGTVYILCVPLLAGIAVMRGSALRIGEFNYTGFLWTSALIAGCLLLLVEKGFRPEYRAYFPLAPWLMWLAVVGASFTWMDEPGLPQVRDAMQLGMPVMVGVIAGLFVRSRQRLVQLVHAFYYSVPVLWCFSLLWFFTDFDEASRPDIYVEKRALALTAVLIGGLYITGTKREFVRGWVGWLVCFGVTVVTGSRTASLVMLLLPILNPVTLNPLRKIAVMTVMGVIALTVYLTPSFQERTFGVDSGRESNLAQGEFDSSGRFDAWPLILEESLERPWLGHGVGTVQRFVPEVWKGVSAPHNDFLRVGFELGIFGLVAFLAVMIWQLWSLSCLVRSTDGVVQQVAGAAWLGLAAFLPIAFTDNPITYTLCYMNPLFVLIGAAYSVAQDDSVDSIPVEDIGTDAFPETITGNAGLNNQSESLHDKFD